MGRSRAVLILAFLLASSSGASADDTELASTQARMGELVEALRVALPLSLDPEQFAAEANRVRLAGALRRLRDGATALSDHAEGRDVGFAHLASALARDAHEIQHRFEVGRFDEARFLLGELAGDCVSCHSRLPYRKRSELGRSLWNAVDASALPLDERVRLQVATRQFDLALQSYESLLRGEGMAPAQLDLGGYLSDYLAITIRVRGELARARRQLDAFRRRGDIPAYLAEPRSGSSTARPRRARRSRAHARCSAPPPSCAASPPTAPAWYTTWSPRACCTAP